MSDLLALASAIEAATMPDPKLDWLIAEAAGEVPPHSICTTGWDYDWYRKPDEWALWRATDSEGRSVELWQPKKRTGSLDASMTLTHGLDKGLAGPNGILHTAQSRLATRFHLHIAFWPETEDYTAWLARYVSAAALRARTGERYGKPS